MSILHTAKPNVQKLLWLEAQTEVLRLIRSPSFYIPTLLFPAVFYSFFGIIFSANTASTASYLMITYAVFGIIGPALFSFGVGIAIERGQGWFALKKVSPMPASAYVISRIFLTWLFSTAVIALLFGIAALFGGVTLMLWQWFALAGVLIIGALPFCALGMVLGLYLKANSAAATVNLIYLPMAFLSGLWLPIQMLPDVIQQFANLLPPYHLAQLALKVTNMDLGFPVLLHLSVLVIYSLLFIFLAVKAYHKEV